MAKSGSKWAGHGSRHDRGYGSQWVKLRAMILQYDSHLCQPCKRAGRVTPATQVDHIIPKAQGGEDEADNLQSICDECHNAKTAQESAEAQGRTVKPRLQFDAKGYPIWPE